jgi:hypothetical protein
MVEACPLAELQRAMFDRLRGELVLKLSGSAEAFSQLLNVASRLESLDVHLSNSTWTSSLFSPGSSGFDDDGVVLLVHVHPRWEVSDRSSDAPERKSWRSNAERDAPEAIQVVLQSIQHLEWIRSAQSAFAPPCGKARVLSHGLSPFC